MSERVGIVGVGLMGQAIAHHLLQSGFEVRGFDIDPKRMSELKQQGGVPVDSAAEAARGARWVLTSLPTGDIVRAAVFGPNGIVEGAQRGTLLTDTSTQRPQHSEALGAELAAHGIRFLDAAISGTSAMVWKKDAIVIAGGIETDFEACQPCFMGFSRAAYLMGPLGSGGLTKLIINMVLAGNRLALAEGLVLGVKAGMNGESLLSVLQDGACSSKTMVDKGPKMLKGEYGPEGKTRNSLKGARLVLEQGARFGSPMQIANLWVAIQQTACEKGLAEYDSISYFEVLREMAGLPRRV